MEKLSAVYLTVLISGLLLLISSPARAMQPKVAGYFGSDYQNAEEAVEMLRTLRLQRDFEGELLVAEEAVEEFPESVPLRAFYLASMARNSRAPEAIGLARELVLEHPENPWSHFALVRTLNSSSGQGDEAVELVDSVLSMMPRHPEFIQMKASVLYTNVGREEAVDYIDSVLREVGETAELLATKGNALLYLSRMAEEVEGERLFEEGLAVLEEVRQIDPDHTDGYYLPGFYYSSRREMDRAYSYLRKAAELSTSERVHATFWRTVMGIDSLSMDQKREEILLDMDSLRERRPETPSMLSAMANQFEMLQMPERQREYQDRILSEFPDDLAAEWVLVNRYRRFNSDHREAIAEGVDSVAVPYRQMLWDFIRRPSHNRMTLVGDAYRSLFHVVREDSTADPDILLEIVNGMVEHEGINPHITHAGGAVALAERGVYFDRAKEIAREGIVLAEEKINEQNEAGLYDTDEDFQRSMGWFTGMMYDALGWVYFQEGRTDSAEKYLSHAWSLNPDSRETIHHLGQFHEHLGEWPKAEEFYVKGMGVQAAGDNPNEGALEMLYIRRTGSPEGFEAYLSTLSESSTEERREKVLAGRIENPERLAPFDLKTLGGETYSSGKLAGKTVVINHWGIWCGPCVAEMPDIQALHEKYRDDPEVTVLTINNDPSIDKVREWMQEHAYDFPVLRDDGYLSRQMVHIFPTTWFLDRESRIAFIKEGYTEPLVEEFTWRIEDLR